MTFQEKRREFEISCRLALTRLKDAQGMVYRSLQKAGLSKKEFWMSHDLQRRLDALYWPEVRTAESLLIASQDWTETDRDLLDCGHEIITDLDAEAISVKLNLPQEVRSRSVLPHEHKCFLRKLVRLHWKVLDGLKARPAVLPLIESEVEDLEAALKDLGFFTCVFICYAHDDNKAPGAYLDRLLDAIREPLRERHCFLWWDWKDKCDETSDELSRAGIVASEEWRHQIEKRLDVLDVALALTSPAFHKSEFITDLEKPRLLDARRLAGLCLIPVRLHDSATETMAEFSRTQMFPRGPNRLADLCSQDDGDLKSLCVPLVDIIEHAFDVCSDHKLLSNHLASFQTAAV